MQKDIARSPAKHTIDIEQQAQGPAALLQNIGSGAATSSGVASSSAASTAPLLKKERQISMHAPSPDGSHVAPASFDVDSSSVGSSSTSAAGGSWAQRMLVGPFKRRIVTPAMAILKSGATPEGLALSLAFGVTGGLFPVPATTTLICVAFVFIFKLNLAAVQLINLLMTPLNLATFVSFIRIGEWLFGAPAVQLSMEPFKSDPLQALSDFWLSLCYGIVAWGLFTPPATFLLYHALKPVMRKAMSGMGQHKSAAD